MRYLTLVIALSLSPACQPAPKAATSTEGAGTAAVPAGLSSEDEAAIRAVDSAWGRAASAGDADALTALYTSDATLLPPNEPAARGDAVKKYNGRYGQSLLGAVRTHDRGRGGSWRFGLFGWDLPRNPDSEEGWGQAPRQQTKESFWRCSRSRRTGHGRSCTTCGVQTLRPRGNSSSLSARLPPAACPQPTVNRPSTESRNTAVQRQQTGRQRGDLRSLALLRATPRATTGRTTA